MESLVFSLDNQLFALNIHRIERVVLSAQLIQIPHSQKNVVGAVNIEGDIIPVFSARGLIGISEKDLELSDRFLICHFDKKKAALWVDGINEIISFPEENLTASQIARIGNQDLYAIKHLDEVIFIYDWNQLWT